MNIPSLSERSIRRDIAESDISLDSKIQVLQDAASNCAPFEVFCSFFIQGAVLDEAARVHPDSWWWIKADGCDITSGLGESVSGEWSGDVNLHEGVLDEMLAEYRRRVQLVKEIGLDSQATDGAIVRDIIEVKQGISSDIDLVTSGMHHYYHDYCDISIAGIIPLVVQSTNHEYEVKQGENKHGKEMFELAWDIKELEDLNKFGRKLSMECEVLKDKLLGVGYDKIDNFAQKLDSFRERVISFLKRVVKYRRVAATHVLVVMISPEERNCKPYALTVQCIAYKGVKDSEMRTICNNLVKEMHARKMKVAG